MFVGKSFLFVDCLCVCFFFKQKTAYEMRISDWSSDVCSSDLPAIRHHLMRMSGIMVRERVSYDYLTQKLGLTNVTMMADPAFTLSPEPVDTAPFWPTFGEAGVLGLNISPLIEIGRAHV